MVIKQQINNWPFPAECPPKPWTPEQQRKWAEEQLKNVPSAPMVLKAFN